MNSRKIFIVIAMVFMMGLVTALWPEMSLAQNIANTEVAGNNISLGTVASNLTVVTGMFSELFNNIFYIIGIVFFVVGIMRYRDFRQNPVQTPLNRVIFYILAGIIIGCFPFIVNYLQHRF